MGEETREVDKVGPSSYLYKVVYGGFISRTFAFVIDISIVGGILLALLFSYNIVMGPKFLVTPMEAPIFTYRVSVSTSTSFTYTLPDGRQGNYQEHEVTPFYYGLVPLPGYTQGELRLPGSIGQIGSTVIAWPKGWEVDRSAVVSFLYTKGLGRGTGRYPEEWQDSFNPYKDVKKAYPRDELMELFGEGYFNLVETKYWGIALYLLYAALLEGSRLQGTIGKRLVRVRITDGVGNPIGFAQSIMRNLSKIASGYILFIGFLMIISTERKQGLHDKIAKTIVVKDQHLDRVRADFAV